MMESSQTEPVVQLPEFSLFRGGLLHRFWLKIGLSGIDLEMVSRRILLVMAVTWLPLLILSVINGTAFKGDVGIPFFQDAAVQARFLAGLPFLLYGEVFAHRRMESRIQNFLRRSILTGEEIPKFQAAIDRAHRIRDSIWLEIGIAVLVCTVGVWSWRSQMVFGTSGWFADPDGTNLNLTLAGYWLAFVSVPIFQFIIGRWYARFLIWLWFLWRVSRLKMDLMPTHPDRAAGIGFLTRATYSFGFVLLTQGAMLSGLIANLVLHNGQHLMEFRMQAIGYIVFFVGLVLAPLTVFIPSLVAAKRKGLSEYGALATEYTRDFGKRWIEKINPKGEELLGTTDIQSLADLGHSFQMIREMWIAPFGFRAVIWLAAVTAAPLLPLAFFIFSPEALVDMLLKVVI